MAPNSEIQIIIFFPYIILTSNILNKMLFEHALDK